MPSLQKLQSILERDARGQGADFFGVADLTSVHETVHAQGGGFIASFPRAVCLGIALPHAIVDQLPHRQQRGAAVSYRNQGYEIINHRLDLAASRLAGILQRSGETAYPVPASERSDDEKICAVFSHKMAARQAGLGWIGKSCLLITPQAGPRVRWVTVLTHAPLKPTGSPMESKCGNCTQCVDICPVNAFTGEPFRQGEPRDVRYNAKRCERYWDEITEKNAWAVCGLCVYACPHGSSKTKGHT